MNQLAEQLDEKLRTLDPPRARFLESRVREAIDEAEGADFSNGDTAWPDGYFEQTAGSLAGEDFERAPQGELPRRDEW